MKKFNFGKQGEGDEDKNRLALFGGRSKNKTPVPSANPYAQPIAAADPYTQARLDAGVARGAGGQSPSNAGYGGTSSRSKVGYSGINGKGYSDESRSGSVGGDTSKLGAGASGYGSDKYGAQSGYGVDRYGAGAGTSQPDTGGSKFGPGGYGGLGSASSYDTTATDDTRNALFGGAQERVQQRSQPSDGLGQPPAYAADYGQHGRSGVPGIEQNQSYGAYDDRQLTAEEEEDEDVEATKQQIRFIKQEDVSSTRNALRIAAQAEETGRNTLARIGTQGESIHNTEKNLDLTANHNRVAEEKARELKALNKSMFAVHVSNPFTAAQRRQQRDDDVLDKHRNERDQREATRKAGYDTDQRLQRTFKDIERGSSGYGKPKESSLAERAKYQFEADEEDDEMENEIDSNLDALSGVAARLNGLARATGKEVDEQNRHLERINDKSTSVDDQIAMNRARLDRFH
ncbi:Protein transport protein S9 plasma membrane t-SNARE [Toensbergia leucococca]|nr:Protein transport protein S9 plasma membrane t-SNARE [Toensbergia leucococca]